MKPAIAIDFDGVLSQFTTWKGDSIVGDAIPGAIEFVRELSKRWTIVIFSSRATTERGKKAIYEWVRRYNLRFIIHDVTNEKGKYHFQFFIDDRAIPFSEPNDFNKIQEYLSKIDTTLDGNKYPDVKRTLNDNRVS